MPTSQAGIGLDGSRRSADATARRLPSDARDLQSFVPALLHFVANRLNSSGSAAYRALFGIGSMDFRVMTVLSIEPGASGARIAEVIGIDKAAVSRTLAQLRRRRLATAAPGPGRIRLLTLTPAGQRLFEGAWDLARERERRLLATLTPDEQKQLGDLLRRVLAAVPHVAELARLHQPGADPAGGFGFANDLQPPPRRTRLVHVP